MSVYVFNCMIICKAILHIYVYIYQRTKLNSCVYTFKSVYIICCAILFNYVLYVHIYTDIHTHTHTHIYIYIYIYI